MWYSYGANWHMGNWGGGGVCFPVGLDAVDYLSEQWMLVDASYMCQGGWQRCDNVVLASGMVWRHNEGGNFGFVDDHVKWLAGDVALARVWTGGIDGSPASVFWYGG